MIGAILVATILVLFSEHTIPGCAMKRVVVSGIADQHQGGGLIARRWLNRLQLPISEPHHLQQQPSIAEARNLGLAECAGLVMNRCLDDL
jgi:hypothetical protein